MIYTHWFPASSPPVRAGVYERKYPLGKMDLVRFSYWDGKRWYVAGHTTDIAETEYKNQEIAPRQKLPWRGLLKDEQEGSKPHGY